MSADDELPLYAVIIFVILSSGRGNFLTELVTSSKIPCTMGKKNIKDFEKGKDVKPLNQEDMKKIIGGKNSKKKNSGGVGGILPQ
ncbi:MAG: hypothetical protein MRY78_11250 [Saprospiraceae bacterium]|nr:hypothetical protein [Saprospiraceae bacterium]